jgi:hypothetical protein
MARNTVSNNVRNHIDVDVNPQAVDPRTSLKPAQQKQARGRHGKGRQRVARRGDLSVVGGNMDGSHVMAENMQPEHSLSTQVLSGQEEKRSYNARFELFLALGLLLFISTVFILGNIFWDERYYVPEEGLGYYLGMTGGILMLLAYSYSLFKYTSFFRSRTIMRHWLTVHICFGVIGPLLIIFHTTFRIHSLNGGIALVSMLLVFVSGVMARFIYARTHYGLDGQKVRVQDLKEQLIFAGHKIKSARLDKFTSSVLDRRDSLPSAIWDLLSFGWRSRWLYFRLTENMRLHLKHMAKKEGWDRAIVKVKRKEFNHRLREYIHVLKKVAQFRVYERFFAFWRNAHAPLLYLLLMSGIVHVIAVHMY